MRFTHVRLVNYIGIYQGCMLNELSIDFTKCKNRICMIKADNGGGKSTLLKALSVYPDGNDMIIPGKPGLKEIGIIDNDIQYEIVIEHPVNKDGSRGINRAYIKKLTDNGYIEMNSTGTIKSYKDFIETEFGLDPNFVILSSLSTEDKGLVDKAPAERKKFVNSIINGVEVYNNINKVLNKRNSINRSMMNNLMTKIENIGEEEKAKALLVSVNNKISELETRKSILQKKISDADSMIQILDPNLEIQTLDTKIRVELESIETELRKQSENLQYMYSKIGNKFSQENCDTLEKCNTLYYEYKNTINSLNSRNNDLKKQLSDILVTREEESKALVLKTQRLQSLQSEYNYLDLETNIKKYREDIDKYETFFNEAHIQNAISITKDEYILGLNTLKDIKDIIDNLRSYSFDAVIKKSIEYIISNLDPISDLKNMSYNLDCMRENKSKLEKDLAYMQGQEEKAAQLVNRPSKCKIDNCPFISDIIAANKLDPSKKKIKLQKDLDDINNKIDQMMKEIDFLEDCVSTIRDIKIILRSIDNNKSIINKLPNGAIFTNIQELLNRIGKGDNFNEINDLYQYINYANMFEEYKIAKDTLYKLEVDYKIYESKNDIIKEIESDVENIENKLSTIVNTITSINKQIEDNDNIILESESYFKDLDTLISILTKVKELNISKEDCESRKNTISTNMEKISLYLIDKENCGNELRRIDSELNPLYNNRDSINYNLKMLQEYKIELEGITKSYNLIEVLKRYSTPSKKGIQNIFIRLYMNQSLTLANKILSMFFDGKMVLTQFNIGEEGFYIPCISMNTGMETDDIKSCSRSEKTMASLALSAAMFKQASTKFNIFKLDEIDEGLDASNRLIYVDALNTILNILEVEQCIAVSHSSELSLGNVDVIKLKIENDTVIANEGNVIFKL